jgi:nucleoside phosphorylase
VSELLVAAPLRIEAALISSAARRAEVRKTGMGRAKSQAAATTLATRPAAALLVVGFCGGLDSGSVPGEVIVAEQVYPAHDEVRGGEALRCDLAAELITHLAGRGMKLRSGPLVCVSKIAVGERRAELHERGAIAVDMESVWLGAAAQGRRFGVVRVVLDSPEYELFRIGAVSHALRAAWALRKVAGALHDWTPAD